MREANEVSKAVFLSQLEEHTEKMQTFLARMRFDTLETILEEYYGIKAYGGM